MVMRLFSLMLVLVNLSGAIALADVTVLIDREEVAENESFALTFQVDKAVDTAPDFAPLERDFEILQRNQQSSTQIVNGRILTERRWVLTLMPRGVGEFEIPPVRFGNEWSQPGRMRIVAARTAAPGAAEIYLEADVSTTQPWVQSQVLYRVRLYVASDVDTRNATLSDPLFDGAEVLVEKLGDDRQYQSTQQGRRYLVVERSYALFPQQSGRLKVLPARLEVQVISRAQRFPRLQRFLSGEIELDVRPIPAFAPGMSGGAWLPATSVSIEELWSTPPEQIMPGEPVTRTVVLVANGLLASQLPELPAPGGSQLRFYPDQPELTDKVNADGFAGRRTERAAIIAPQAGRYVVPGMTIPWWNTETGSWETAELPSRDIDVVSLAPATDALVAGDAFPADGEDAPGDTARADSPFLVELVWLLAVGWLATLLAWSYTSRRNRSQRGHRRERQRLSGQRARAATRQARHAAVRACREGGAKDCRTAVLEWARLEWPEANVRTLAGAAAIAGGELAAQILELESALYSPDTIEWSPDGLAAVLRRYDRVRLGQPSRDESALAPLHP